jgi:plastocyanin
LRLAAIRLLAAALLAAGCNTTVTPIDAGADLVPLPDLATAADLASTGDLATGASDLSGGTVHMITVGPGGALAFDPPALTIKAGDTVTWTFASSGHTVNSGNPVGCVVDSKFCSPSDTNCSGNLPASAGNTYSHTFPTAGTFPYFCRPHCFAQMTGTITVQ